MNKNYVCGEFPKFCYKAFQCEKYAKQFMEKGSFRMGCQYSYREIEDEWRRDKTEGAGRTIEPGIVTSYGYSPNPKEKPIIKKEFGYQDHDTELCNIKFCFCTSLQDVDLIYMKKQFGRFIVKIKEPRQLAEDINDYLFSTGEKFRIEGRKAVYNKGQRLERELTSTERIDLSYKQKPESFKSDCEFRIVAVKLGEVCKELCKFRDVDGVLEPKCKFIEINFGKKLSYLRRI